MSHSFLGTLLKQGLVALAVMAGLGGYAFTAFAQKGLDEPFRGKYLDTLKGKTVAFVPVAMGFDLAQGWLAGLKRELDPLGVKVVVRDPNWNTAAGAQAMTTLISENPKPDVIVAHTPTCKLTRTCCGRRNPKVLRSSKSTCALPTRPRCLSARTGWILASARQKR